MLGHHHIQLGTRLRVLRSFSFDGSIEISVTDQKPVTISHQLAKTLLVKLIEHD
jgi:hypothetical protein